MFVLKVWDGGVRLPEAGGEPTSTVPITDGLQVGRAASEGHCRLLDPNAGREAAKIVMVGGRYFVEDCGSRNATVIRGVGRMTKGQRVELQTGMVLEVGRSALVVCGQAEFPEVDSERTVTGEELGSNTYPGPIEPEPLPRRGGGLGSLPSPVRAERPTDPPIEPPPPPPPRPAPAPPVAKPRTNPPAPPLQHFPPPPMAFPERMPPAARGASHPPSSHTRPPPEDISPVTPDFGSAPAREPSRPPQPGRPLPQLSPEQARVPIDESGGTLKISPENPLAVIGALTNAAARLVIVNDADRRIVPIRVAEFLVGRKRDGESSTPPGDRPERLAFAHPGVSERHAMIRFVLRTNSFQISDLGSRNQTIVGTLALNKDVLQPLAPETLICFGPIEAVFVVSRDASNELIPASRYATALQFLLADKQITAEQARMATAEAAAKGDRHVGEALMLAGILSARAWTRAFEQAATYRPPPQPVGSTRRWIWIAVAALTVIVLGALAWIFRGALGMG